MLQNILVGLILLLALLWAGGKLFLILKGKSSACDSCINPTSGSCSGAKSASKEPHTPIDIF